MKTLLKTCTIIAAGGLLAPYAMEPQPTAERFIDLLFPLSAARPE